MKLRPLLLAPLLFVSGACALIYQTAWLRELRLVFGASTAASAAVLAIFMGGLGVGGAVLGRRADRHARPLLLYAHLEILGAAAAALSPALLWLVRHAYGFLGGTQALGLLLGTLLRLVLSALVLGVPVVLLGGTLPAATRAITDAEDRGRRGLALLYGANSLGAVTGALLSTFWLLESCGMRLTLFLGCGANLAVGLYARRLALRTGEAAPAAGRAVAPAAGGPRRRFVLLAAAVSGFSFFLLELVWYRMLGPLLGGSSYAFGLVLAVALLGIGLGALLYTLFGAYRTPTPAAFAASCLLQAGLIALPYALGDRLALFANSLRVFATFGFTAQVLGWAVLCSIVVLPAALLAGMQFPLLIALLGTDAAESVGAEVGLAYAWNTAGAIAGSLLGGFGLLPLLSAPGAWRLAAGLLLALGVAAAVHGRQQALRLLPLALVAVVFLRADGPGVLWRHSGIGAGRAVEPGGTRNALRNFARSRRRFLLWEREGIESSVAVTKESGLAFVLNGRADGNAWADAPTQVSGGLLGALLHPRPRSALIIGLGTGSTAGWLGALPSIERVDVVELEPAVLQVARECAAVNRDVLSNPRVHVIVGDAREVLLSGRQQYDVIFSEPSNPYRAGIASLFTEEFYRAVRRRLADPGVFVQWVQGYEIDAETLRTIYATMQAVFPAVETWQPVHGDLFLVGSAPPVRYDADALGARLAEEPYRSAFQKVFRAVDLEGLLARYVARGSLAAAIATAQRGRRNTDDRTRIEFGFARAAGHKGLFDPQELWQAARARREDRPEVRGTVAWDHVEDQRVSMLAASESPIDVEGQADPERRTRASAEAQYVEDKLDGALYSWSRLRRQAPMDLLELVLMAEILADAKSEAALPFINKLRGYQPVEADAVLARLRFRQGRWAEAGETLARAFEGYRADPWPLESVMRRALRLSAKIAAQDRGAGERLFAALERPFAVYRSEEERLGVRLQLAQFLDFRARCQEALRGLEPNVPWQRGVLALRAKCYDDNGDPRKERAWSELRAFLAAEPPSFGADLLPLPAQ